MKTDQIVRRQLATRLSRLKARAVTLAAEIAMIEQNLADAERAVAVPRLKLRKNSAAKWSVQGHVRRALEATSAPVRAQYLFDTLRRHDPTLKSSTFRSHIKRMVDAGIIQREGSRGHYQIARKANDVQVSDKESTRRRRRVKHSIYER